MLAAAAVYSEAKASSGQEAQVSPVNWIVWRCSAKAPVPPLAPNPA